MSLMYCIHLLKYYTMTTKQWYRMERSVFFNDHYIPIDITHLELIKNKIKEHFQTHNYLSEYKIKYKPDIQVNNNIKEVFNFNVDLYDGKQRDCIKYEIISLSLPSVLSNIIFEYADPKVTANLNCSIDKVYNI